MRSGPVVQSMLLSAFCLCFEFLFRFLCHGVSDRQRETGVELIQLWFLSFIVHNGLKVDVHSKPRTMVDHPIFLQVRQQQLLQVFRATLRRLVAFP